MKKFLTLAWLLPHLKIQMQIVHLVVFTSIVFISGVVFGIGYYVNTVDPLSFCAQ